MSAGEADRIKRAFADLHGRLAVLAKRLNPRSEDLHFHPVPENLDAVVVEELVKLAEDGAARVREHEEFFLRDSWKLYADGMFWCAYASAPMSDAGRHQRSRRLPARRG